MLSLLFLSSCEPPSTQQLIDAVKTGDIKKVESYLEKGVDINSRGGLYLWPPLHYAVHDNNLDMVKLLIDKGANVNRKTMEQVTALMWATDIGNTEIVLENGADIDAINFKGHTALIIAVRKEKLEMVKFLIDNNAELNTKSNYGQTTLDEALEYDLKEIVAILMKNNAKLGEEIR